jgi:hypothetical protein
MNKINLSRRQLRIKEKLASNFGDLWFKNEKFIIVDHEPISDNQKEQVYLEIQTRVGKDTPQSLIDWSIEDGKLFCFIDIDGTQEKVHTSWFNKTIRVLKNLKTFRTSTNSNTLYRREVIDFRFKKGQLISKREFLQEFPYVQIGRRLGRPLKPYIRD